MAETARTSLLSFYEFTAGYVASLEDVDGLLHNEAEDDALELLGPAPSPGAPLEEEAAAAAPLRAPSEVWVDATGELPLPAVEDEHAPALYLRYLCSTGDQGVALLSQINRRLAALQTSVVEQGPRSRLVPASALFLAGFASGVAVTALLWGIGRRSGRVVVAV